MITLCCELCLLFEYGNVNLQCTLRTRTKFLFCMTILAVAEKCGDIEVSLDPVGRADSKLITKVWLQSLMYIHL